MDHLIGPRQQRRRDRQPERLGGLDVECSARNFRRTDGVHVSLMGRPGVYQSVRHGNHRSKLSVMCGRYTSAVAFETIT